MVLKQYNPTFAIMKGIAIVSVVLGHCNVSPFVDCLVNQYHLAVFFFVAGYFFKGKYLDSPKSFIIKRLKSLYIPYVIYGLLALALHNIFCQIDIVSDYRSISSLVLGGQNLMFKLYSDEVLMGAMWFCPALLMVSFMSYFMLLATKGNKKQGMVLCLTFALLGALCCKFHIKSPYCVWQYMQVCPIFCAGFLFKDFERFMQANMVKIASVILSITFVLSCISKDKFSFLQPYRINDENVVFIVLIGIVGSLGVYCISSLIKTSRLGNMLSIIGNYSFSIMALHFLAFKIINVVQCYVFDYQFSKISQFPYIRTDQGWWVLYLWVGVLAPIFLSMIYYKLLKYVRSSNN